MSIEIDYQSIASQVRPLHKSLKGMLLIGELIEQVADMERYKKSLEDGIESKSQDLHALQDNLAAISGQVKEAMSQGKEVVQKTKDKVKMLEEAAQTEAQRIVDEARNKQRETELYIANEMDQFEKSKRHYDKVIEDLKTQEVSLSEKRNEIEQQIKKIKDNL